MSIYIWLNGLLLFLYTPLLQERMTDSDSIAQELTLIAELKVSKSDLKSVRGKTSSFYASVANSLRYTHI